MSVAVAVMVVSGSGERVAGRAMTMGSSTMDYQRARQLLCGSVPHVSMSSVVVTLYQGLSQNGFG